MKIKSLLAYYIPFLVLFFLVFTVLFSVPPEPASVKACKRYASCVAMSSSAPNWINFR
ncbi:hypothetical protein D3C76_1250110 [compost metagenome]|jgi:hypothetical protein|uniref:Uncharacterized protein n=1 Tax=Pseudomonas umsongensis TaxID=198618 RepID=A0AAE6ZZL5_9PSED|nr:MULTISPECIES: hypothetical protein [Pseudomonas]EPA92624.1 hypothetical protein PG5_64020 [Pseudomonas sp. G5(2012)]MDI3392645.1 hypothetical protein [Pseudomonas sp. V98_8]QJC80611.1 hypothetical protein HGP31_20620 [Pseudomonas umsongensis]SDT51326.1 hypothetical protein SAMN04490206_3450 [Pseudomonas umsongensis]